MHLTFLAMAAFFLLTLNVSAQIVVADADILKKLSLEELMNLDVTSVAKQPEPYGQAPAAIQVVTGDEIRRSGATSIPESLRLADNLNVAQENSHDWAISARGFNAGLANKLLVMMDGRTIYTPLFSGVFWNVQDYLLEDIDRIEVVSGPGGTLWGANAVNGVINITSKSAKDTQGLYLEGGAGSSFQDFGGVRFGGTLDSNIYYRVYGKYFDRGDEVYPNGSTASNAWRMGQGGFRIDSEAGARDKMTLQGDIYDSGVNVATGGDGEASGGNIIGRWSHTISDDSDMSLQMYFDRTHLYDPISNQFYPTYSFLTDDLTTYDMDFQHRFLLMEGNHMVWGLGVRYTHDVLTPAINLTFVPSILDQGLFSGFVQDELPFSNNFSLIVGSKLEHNDYTGFEVEPSARLKWEMTSNEMLWAAVSRAVRTPSRVDHDVLEPVSAHPVLVGGANFESETVIAYELGYRAQWTPKVSTSISTFFNNYDDIRSLSFTPTTIIPLYFANNLAAQTWGGELITDYQMFDWWRLHVGYDMLNETVWVKPGQIDLNNALNETADPPNQVFLRSSMDLPGNFELDPALRWIDSIHNNNGAAAGLVQSYFELDTRLGWHPVKNLEISVVGQNLLHDQHAEYGFPNSAQVQIVRSVYGKVVLRF